MEFIFSSRLENGRLRSRLLAAHTAAMKVTTRVQVAAAYASRTDHPILVDCTREKIRCEVWSRHDHSLATTVPVLEWAFRQQRAHGNLTWRLLGSFYHPKVVWWHGYGVYVGSANLSESAWFSNCEAGTLLLEADLDEAGLRQPLIDFFADVHAQSKPITEQLIKDANALLPDEGDMEAIRQRMKKRFKESDSGAHFTQEGLATVQAGTSARDQRKTKFLEEWDTTLGYLGIVGDRLKAAGLPDWVPRDASSGLHIDQFLHAYYYEKVRQNRSFPVEDFHQRHSANPEAALAEAIAWWRATPTPPAPNPSSSITGLPFIANCSPPNGWPTCPAKTSSALLAAFTPSITTPSTSGAKIFSTTTTSPPLPPMPSAMSSAKTFTVAPMARVGIRPACSNTCSSTAPRIKSPSVFSSAWKHLTTSKD